MNTAENMRPFKPSGTTLPPLLLKVMALEATDPAQCQTSSRMCGFFDSDRYAIESTEVAALHDRLLECLVNVKSGWEKLGGTLSKRKDLRAVLVKARGEVCTPSRLDLAINKDIDFTEALDDDENLQRHMHELMCVLSHYIVRIDAVRCCVQYIPLTCTPEQTQTSNPAVAAQAHPKAE